MTATVTIAGTAHVFDKSNGFSLGDYVDPDGAFTQSCVRVTNPDVPYFTVMFRSDVQAGATREEVVFELGAVHAAQPLTGTTAAYDIAPYSVVIAKGSTTLASITLTKTHYWHQRWRWQSAPRPVRKTAAQLIAAKLVPNYDASIKTGGANDNPNVTYEYLGDAGITHRFGNTGERSDIGPVTDYQAQWLCGINTAANLTSILAQGEASGSIPWHYRDENTGGPVDTIAFPNTGVYFNHLSQDPWMPGRKPDGWEPDSPHNGAFAYLPFLLTGDPYFLEELQYSDLFCLIETPPPHNTAANFGDNMVQVRGFAWAVRNRMQLAKVTPAAAPSWMYNQAYIKHFLDLQRDGLIANVVNSTDALQTVFNLFYGNLDNSPEVNPFPVHTAYPPWQEDFLHFIVGWAMQMGFSDWQPIWDFGILNLMARTGNTSGWPRTFPSTYQIQARTSGGAGYQGAIAGITLTVSKTAGSTAAWGASGTGTSGNLANGQTVTSTGTGTNVLAGTTITNQLTSNETDGALGKTGTYQVNNSQTVTLRAMTGNATPVLTSWPAAWTLFKQTTGAFPGGDPTVLSTTGSDFEYHSYAQGALAIATAVPVTGITQATIRTAFDYLHGQMVTQNNFMRWKWAIARV